MRAALLALIAAVFVAVLPAETACAQNRPPDGAAAGESTQDARSASPASPPAGRPATSAANSAIEASPLDTVLMRDAKGNLVPVVGIPFEEFEQLLRAKKGLSPAAPPPYTLETMTVVGKPAERSADFQLTATIRVRENGWIRVPLYLPSAVVRQPLEHEGPGECFLTFDAAADGYVCWLNGNDARPHVIRLAVSLPITSAGQEQRLAMMLPRATESTLRLVVDAPAVDATLVSGEGVPASRSLANGLSEITVVGAAGDLQLAYHSRRKAASGPMQLDASGEISVRIHSEHRIAADARLRVRSYGAPLESFRVYLPPGMELISTTTSGGYSLSVVDAEANAGKAKNESTNQQVVEVRLDKPAATAEVLLRAQREADTAATGWFSPAQFKVSGAIRQRGTIDFSMEEEWHLDWKADKTVHRIELLPDTAAASVVARYEYFQQPCGLAVKVSARPSRISVEPVHRIYVESDRVRIESLLKYRFRGARADGLTFEMGDWVFDRLTPDNLLDFPLEDATKAGMVRVPFRPGATPPTELELKLEGHRTLAPGTQQLLLNFPRPAADITVPASILIFAADNIELTPLYDLIESLSAEGLPARPMDKEHPALVFRDLGGDEPSRFAARLQVLKRSTHTAAKAIVRIERHQIHVEQRIDYQVAHEPERQFSLLAPAEVASSDSLDITMNGQSAPVRQVLAPSGDASQLIRLQFTAPQPMLGNFSASIRYALPLAWDRKSSLSFSLPLVLPADDVEQSFAGQQVQFQLATDVNIEPEQSENEEVVQPVAVRGAVQAYTWDRAATFSQWSLVPGVGASGRAADVSQLWVQTWLTPEIRYERVALRLSTSQESVRLMLPRGVRTASVSAAVDSEKVEPVKNRLERASPTSSMEIAIPLKKRSSECVIEVWYSLDPPPRWLGFCSGELQIVRIPDVEPPRRAYWQLLTVPGEHLICLPDGLTAEMAWSSDRFHMFRRPILDQRQLESWMKASRQDLLPLSAHEYLFGAVARWPVLNVHIARSSVIVALTSAATLAIGLALLHLPVLRRPDIMFAVTLGLAAGSMLWPDTAILAGQASVMGLAILVLVAIWSLLSASGPGRAAHPVAPSPSKALPAPSTHAGGSRRQIDSRLGTTHGAPLVEARP